MYGYQKHEDLCRIGSMGMAFDWTFENVYMYMDMRHVDHGRENIVLLLDM